MHKYKCTVCILAVIHGILTVVTAYHLNRQIRKVNISQNCTTDTAAINISQPKPPSVSVNPEIKTRHYVKQSSGFVGIPVLKRK